MAKKEERIWLEYDIPKPKGAVEATRCTTMTRQEAIERIAKAIWEVGYHKVLNTSLDELKTKSHKSKSRTFSDFYKLTMERAEAAMNALLEEK